MIDCDAVILCLSDNTSLQNRIVKGQTNAFFYYDRTITDEIWRSTNRRNELAETSLENFFIVVARKQNKRFLRLTLVSRD